MSNKQQNDLNKRSQNYNQSKIRRKEMSPTITTGNQSSRRINYGEDLIRNAVGGPFS
jgi:hypothetical protein